jgi:nitroreductase
MNDLIKKRWSPRAFEDKEISQEDLDVIFTSAGRAPSAFNGQPWKFIVGDRYKNKETYDKIVSTLNEFNQMWAPQAPVLIITVAEVISSYNGEENGTAIYDLGGAAAYLSLQAMELGIYSHQMSAFDPEKAAELFSIDTNHKAISAIALGYMGDKNTLPEGIAEKETPESDRKPLSEIRFEVSL